MTTTAIQRRQQEPSEAEVIGDPAGRADAFTWEALGAPAKASPASRPPVVVPRPAGGLQMEWSVVSGQGRPRILRARWGTLAGA